MSERIDKITEPFESPALSSTTFEKFPKVFNDPIMGLFNRAVSQPVLDTVDFIGKGYETGKRAIASGIGSLADDDRLTRDIYGLLTIGEATVPIMPKLNISGIKNINKDGYKLVDEMEEAKEYVNPQIIPKDKQPKKSVKAYKLFRKGKDEKIYPLFVDSKTPVPEGEWLKATDSFHFLDKKGVKRVPAKTGDAQPIANKETVEKMKELGINPTVTEKALKASEFGTVQSVKYRPGWHGDTLPKASHLKKGGDRVWAEVEFADDIDYQNIANKSASKDLDYIPEGGTYRFKTNPNMEGSWMISGEMKVNKVLDEKEVQNILKKESIKKAKGGQVSMRDGIGDIFRLYM